MAGHSNERQHPGATSTKRILVLSSDENEQCSPHSRATHEMQVHKGMLKRDDSRHTRTSRQHSHPSMSLGLKQPPLCFPAAAAA